MNSKTRVILLSVFAVLFAAASVFAITAEDFSSMVVYDYDITPSTTEGYNYMQRVYVDTSYLEEGQTIGAVSWEVSPAYDWLTWRLGSDDKNVIIEGVLPAYSEDKSSYILHVIAHVSGDIDTGETDPETYEPIYTSGDISADVDGTGLEIAVDTQDETTVGLLTDMVSIDASGAKHGLNHPGKDYSVTINFPTTTATATADVYDSEGEVTGTTTYSTDVYVNAELTYDSSDIESFAYNLNLPSWLSYEVLATQYKGTYATDSDALGNVVVGDLEYDDSTAYVKTLRIFYSADTEPAGGTPGNVRILVTPSDVYPTDAEGAQSLSEKYENGATIGWSMDYYAIPSIELSADKIPESFTYGKTTSFDVYYRYQQPATTVISPDISGDVAFAFGDVVRISEDENNEYGYFTVSVNPVKLADAVYSTDLVVTDQNGNTASLPLSINVVVPSIKLSQTSANLSAAFGSTASKVITYDTVEYSADVISPAVSSDFNFSVEVSTDAKTITLSIAPKLSADYTGTLTIYDVYGKSADIALTLHSFMSGDPEVKVSGDQAVRIITTGTTGGVGTVTLNAGNAFGNVLWEVLNIPSGFTFTPLMYTGNPATFTISTDASVTTKTAYSADVRATDEYGRPTTFHLTWTVEPPALVLSGDFSPNPLNVYAGNKADTELAFLYAEPKSGDFWFMSPDISADVSFDVSWTLANKDSADTTASADSIITEGKFTVRANPLHVESKDYTTTFYFTDSNDNVVSAELTVSVTIPVITLSSDNPVVHMSKPPFVTDWPDWHTEWYYAKPVSIDLSVIPSGLSFDCVSSDETNDTVKHGRFIFAYMPMTTTGWSGTVKVYDEYGGSADIKISLDVELSSEPMKTTVTVSGDSSSSPTITAGESRTITLTADNAYGKVRWGVSNMAALQALGITLNKVSETKTTAVYTIGTPLTLPAGTYTANITATDSVDRTAAVYNLTITAKAAPIVLSGDFASIDVVYPASGEATVDYYYSPFTSWSMSPDISADVSLDVTGIPAESTTVQGKITVTATPLTASADKYTTTLTFTDENGNTASRDITINVTLPDLAVTASAASLTLIEGNSADVTITASGNVGLVTWTLGDIPDGITVESSDTLNATQYDTVRSYVVTAVSADSYSFDVTAKDAAGRTASVTINVAVTASGDFAVVPEFNSLAVDVNTPRNISFTAVNNSGDVTWKLGDVPSGIRVEPAAIPYATENHTLMLYTVTGLVPGASGTITATATDAAGNTASATVTITVSGAPATFSITPSAPSVTVNAGATQNVSLTASGNSGTVTWTLGTVTSGITVTPATQTGTTASYTVTGTTAGTYSVTVTATDAAGHSATATISITVSTGTLTITPATTSVTVGVGITQNVSFTASGNSGIVSWTVSTTSTAFTVASAASTYATQDNTRTAFAITGVTAGASGTVTVTATDAAGNSATATINVTVSHPTPTPIPISTPRIDITDTTVRSNIVQSLAAKLGSKITSSTEVATLPSGAASGNISYVGTNTVYIPTIVVEVAKIYVFGVSVDNLVAGSTMTWTPHVSSSSTGEYLTASEEEENATFLDDSNNIVTKVPANKHVNVAAYFEPDKTYSPTITTSTTPSTSGDIIGITSSSGGCSAGLGALVSALAAAFFISKKRS